MAWANSQTGSATSGTGTTISSAFGSNVTVGQIVCVAGVMQGATGGTGVTVSDIATTPNVTSWHTTSWLTNQGSYTIYVSWGVATLTGPCTPQAATDGLANQHMEIYIGAFTPPAGTVSQDGSVTTGNGAASPANTAGGGSGTDDLLVSYALWGGAETGYGTWTAMGAAQSGDAAGYLLNAAGNTANALTGSGQWSDIVLALTASAAPTPNPEIAAGFFAA